MKIFSSSPNQDSDLQKISQLDTIQKQLRELRDDNIKTHKELRTITKGIALMVSAPENDSSEMNQEDGP